MGPRIRFIYLLQVWKVSCHKLTMSVPCKDECALGHTSSHTALQHDAPHVTMGMHMVGVAHDGVVYGQGVQTCANYLSAFHSGLDFRLMFPRFV